MGVTLGESPGLGKGSRLKVSIRGLGKVLGTWSSKQVTHSPIGPQNLEG